MLDQRRLPAEEVYHTYTDYREVAKAISDMVIRGAPAIGVAAAMGVALGVQRSEAHTWPSALGIRHEFATRSRNAPHGRRSFLGHRANEAPVR